MSSEQEILAALKALAEEDSGKEAPAEVEARLVSVFRARRGRPVWAWFIAAAAAIVVVVAAMYFRPKPAEEANVVANPPGAIQRQAVQEIAPEPAAPVVRPLRRRVPREVVTEFFPLMDAPPPLDRAELMRVNLPASAMRTVGLPVREDRLNDRVQADVLVSEEGLATAIRFVKYQ